MLTPDRTYLFIAMLFIKEKESREIEEKRIHCVYVIVYKMKTERREYREKNEENTRNLTANQIASFNF